MPQYEVVTSPGVQYPVGFTFETDALHPAMQQHVRLMRGKKTAAKAEPTGNTAPDPEDLVGELYVSDVDEAFDLAAAEYAEREAPPVKQVDASPPAKAKTAPAKAKNNQGPGENS